MRRVTKHIVVEVYTPQEALDKLLEDHPDVLAIKDRIFADGKFDFEVLNSGFIIGYGVDYCEFKDYLRGFCNYYADDFFVVFEQDNKLYALTYIV